MNKLEISVSSEICNIVKIENFIEKFVSYFQLSDELFGRISLSVIEAVNNAILSGNKRDPDKMVIVSAEKLENQFRVTVKDEGEGFDYTNIPDPTLPNDLNKVCGHGLYLMHTLSDNLIFENNGASVTLIFDL
ncbi:ATP-binding protein [Odoribacter sp. Z80]|uniref:ATP-binding protein n=1 Tax=Odoribacter sp. Z80 TaxID=2304575 RepID=UPI00137B29F5|nr:ATP-binding protein [Odoribacter sp. Z80]NCE72254.1 ATP-binding protein [Odoribacter sp. Z80]